MGNGGKVVAFTNPILAGDSLIRNAIQSDNYMSGASGWRLGTDGSMQVEEIAVRTTLWCNELLYQGKELSAYFDELAGGVVAWLSGYYDVSTTSEAAVGWLEAQVISGHIYNIVGCTNTHNPSTTNMEFKCRYVTGTSAWPTNSSAEMATTYPPIQQWQQQFINAVYRATFTGTLRLRFSVRSLNPPNTVQAQSLDPGSMFVVTDLGSTPAAGPGAIGVTQPGGKVLHEWTITANSSRTYHGDGTLRPVDMYQYDMVMGDWNNGRGNQRGWCTFSTSDVNTYLNDLIGVPYSDIQVAEVRLDPFQWRQGSNDGYISLGYHPVVNSLPTTEPASGLASRYLPYVIGYGVMWFGLKSPVPSVFLDSMRDGSLKGFMVGNSPVGSAYCGAIEAVGDSYPPQLHMKYLK